MLAKGCECRDDFASWLKRCRLLLDPLLPYRTQTAQIAGRNRFVPLLFAGMSKRLYALRRCVAVALAFGFAAKLSVFIAPFAAGELALFAIQARPLGIVGKSNQGNGSDAAETVAHAVPLTRLCVCGGLCLI